MTYRCVRVNMYKVDKWEKIMSNPTLNEQIFQDNMAQAQMGAMTLNGTIYKTLFLLLIVVLAGALTWGQFVAGNTQLVQALMMTGIIVGFILALIIAFTRTTAPFLAPIYAAAEGLALGGISAIFEAQFPGIVFQAVVASLAATFTMLALYMSNVIRATDKFRKVILITTIAVGVMYLVSFIFSLFGINFSFIYDSSPLSIGISCVVVIIASLNLIMDFDIIERGVNTFAPKYFEWYCSFGLLVTLVWLYMEILRLLAKLNRK